MSEELGSPNPNQHPAPVGLTHLDVEAIPVPWYQKALPDPEEFIKSMPEEKLREGATIAYSAAKSYMDFLRLCMEGINLVRDLIDNPQEVQDGNSNSK